MIVLTAFFAWIAAGSLIGPPTLDDSTVITLERGPCFGKCPEYVLALYGSGRVEFAGRRYVCAKGQHSASVDPGSVRQLVDDLITGGYFSLPAESGRSMPDTSVVVTSLRHGGREHRVTHLGGHRGGASRFLERMEVQIDLIARSARWLPERLNHRPVCHREDGTVETVER